MITYIQSRKGGRYGWNSNNNNNNTSNHTNDDNHNETIELTFINLVVRTQISQFELFELIILLNLGKLFSSCKKGAGGPPAQGWHAQIEKCKRCLKHKKWNKPRFANTNNIWEEEMNKHMYNESATIKIETTYSTTFQKRNWRACARLGRGAITITLHHYSIITLYHCNMV